MTIISKFRTREDDPAKTRSSSLESAGSVFPDTDASRRVSEESRKSSAPYITEKNGVLTASLTIPMPLNLEDDIPYIEEGDSRQQVTITRTPTAPPRRRQRSMSGSDSSAGSLAQQAITGSISLVQGYDSAIGSSVTFSTPVQNTPSSVSSSIADAGVYSSPPSWASTPPTSPDSAHTSVNYIPDEVKGPGKLQKSSTVIPSPQKVQFSDAKVGKGQESKPWISSGVEAREQKFTPSITNIGNAVLRSKTADFERIAKTDAPKARTASPSSSDKKKYTKRRYTDSRHQTRHIPDSESLEQASSAQVKKEGVAQVYKRRELISSVPSK